MASEPFATWHGAWDRSLARHPGLRRTGAESMRQFEHAAQRAGDESRARLAAAGVKLAVGELEEARSLLTDLSGPGLGDVSVEARYILSRLRLLDGQPEAAEGCLSGVDSTVQTPYGRALALTLGMAAVKRRDWERASGLFGQALECAPPPCDEDVWLASAEMHKRRGEFGAARDLYARASAGPDGVTRYWSMLGLGWALARMGAWPDAEAQYTRALSVDDLEPHGDAWYLLGRLAFDQGAHSLAIGRLRRALEDAAFANRAQALHVLGAALAEWGDSEQAARALELALDCEFEGDVDRPLALHALAVVRVRMGLWEEAHSLYDAVIADPGEVNLAMVWRDKGEAYLIQGDPESALQCARRALEFGDRALPALLMARVYLAAGRPVIARRWCIRALSDTRFADREWLCSVMADTYAASGDRREEQHWRTRASAEAQQSAGARSGSVASAAQPGAELRGESED